MEHTLWLCNGQPLHPGGGSWIGHVWPACMFIFWASHWTLGTFAQYLNSNKQEPYKSNAWAKLFKFNAPIEPIVLSVLPCLAILLELWLAHADGWRRLICPPGSLKEGHFQANILQNWQHAAMYPGFILLGVVELIGRRVELPSGTQHVFLSVGFAAEALLMGLHKKELPLDQIIHQLLFYSMLSTSFFALLEVPFPHSFLATFARIGSVFLQGSWFIATARILYDGRDIPWDAKSGDMGPVMYMPVLFLIHILFIIGGMATVLALMKLTWHRIGWSPSDRSASPSPNKAGLLSDTNGSGLKASSISTGSKFGGLLKFKDYRPL